MDLKNIFLFITAGMNVGLGFFIFLRDRKNRINISFSLMLLFIAIWSFTIGLFRASSDPATLSFLLNQFYLDAAIIAIAFFYFTRYFPYESRPISTRANVINFVITAAIVLLVFSTGIVKDIYLSPSGDHTVKINPTTYFLYTVYFCAYIIISFAQLIGKIKESTGYVRRLILIVFSATLLAAIFGSVFDLFMPLVTYQYIWAGPYFTALMVLIIVRYVFIKKLE